MYRIVNEGLGFRVYCSLFVFVQCQTCGGLDNEGAGGQQEGAFEVFEGGRGTGSASIHDTGEVER